MAVGTQPCPKATSLGSHTMGCSNHKFAHGAVASLCAALEARSSQLSLSASYLLSHISVNQKTPSKGDNRIAIADFLVCAPVFFFFFFKPETLKNVLKEVDFMKCCC